MTRVEETPTVVETLTPDDEFTILLIQGDRILLAETFTGVPYIFETQAPGVMLRCETHKMGDNEKAFAAHSARDAVSRTE